jgi:hypothetical protein
MREANTWEDIRVDTRAVLQEDIPAGIPEDTREDILAGIQVDTRAGIRVRAPAISHHSGSPSASGRSTRS